MVGAKPVGQRKRRFMEQSGRRTYLVLMQHYFRVTGNKNGSTKQKLRLKTDE
jgi:hypothetical protein